MTRFLFILAAAVNGLAPRPSAPASNPAAGKIRSGRAPSFSSQDLTNLVKNELAPKPWLPPSLSFRVDFPKTGRRRRRPQRLPQEVGRKDTHLSQRAVRSKARHSA